MAGIFAKQSNFTRYRGRLQFRDRCLGGTPQDPKAVEGWLKSRAGITDEFELHQAMLRTLTESGVQVSENMTYEQIEAAVAAISASQQTSGFKRDEHGLYLESRVLKACLKECTSILFEWQGSSSATKKAHGVSKSPYSFLAERVFVSPDRLWLSRKEPDGIFLLAGHTRTGSHLSQYEYVEHAELRFDILISQNAVPAAWWPSLWNQAEEIGLGALRSQSFGKFDLLSWEQVDPLSSAPAPELASPSTSSAF